MYTFFTVIRRFRKAGAGSRAEWLLAAGYRRHAVGLQLGTLLSTAVVAYREALLFFTLCMYLLGGMLYILVITIIFYRFSSGPCTVGT